MEQYMNDISTNLCLDEIDKVNMLFYKDIVECGMSDDSGLTSYLYYINTQAGKVTDKTDMDTTIAQL